MRDKLFYLVSVTFMAFHGPAVIALAECPDFEIVIKEVDSPASKTWKNLYMSYKSYPGCDDGALAEGYSDFVVQSLAKYWSRFDELVSLIKKDSSFKVFVLKHIDATTDLGDLQRTETNAREKCPASKVPFCKEIEIRARAAIEDIKTYENKE